MIDFLQIIYPPRCIFCGKVLGLDFFNRLDKVCQNCFEAVPFIRGGCEICGDVSGCCRCGEGERFFSRNFSLFEYDGAVSNAIYNMKYNGKKLIGREFGKLIMKRVEFPECFFEQIDVITPVPISRFRKIKRGYNQSELIAKEIGKETGVLVDCDMILRVKDTKPLFELSKEERILNVSGAFELNKGRNINGKTILLVDDIFTTGATINECGKTLRQKGAKQIFSISIAKTIKKH